MNPLCITWRNPLKSDRVLRYFIGFTTDLYFHLDERKKIHSTVDRTYALNKPANGHIGSKEKRRETRERNS